MNDFYVPCCDAKYHLHYCTLFSSFGVLLKCWSRQPCDRPSFAQLRSQFAQLNLSHKSVPHLPNNEEDSREAEHVSMERTTEVYTNEDIVGTNGYVPFI